MCLNKHPQKRFAAKPGRGRLLVQAVCEGRDPGDLTTLDDPSALEQIKLRVAG